MERNYKANKNSKLQNLFLCQKQIKKLKSKLLNLIQSPCPLLQHPKKTFTIISPHRNQNSSSKSKSKTKNPEQIEPKTLKLKKQNNQRNSKKAQCPCNSYQTQLNFHKQKKRHPSQSPLKSNNCKEKICKKSKFNDLSPQKNVKIKPLMTESTDENNTDPRMRTPQQIYQMSTIDPIKKTISVNYSFQDSFIQEVPSEKRRGNQIKIQQSNSFANNFSEVKRLSKTELRQSFVSPLNSKYFKAYQQSRMINDKKSKDLGHSLSYSNNLGQSAFFVDEESGESRIVRSKQQRSENQFTSAGMKTAKNNPSFYEKEYPEKLTTKSKIRYDPVQGDLNLLEEIYQKTQRFMGEEIYPFKEILCKTQKSTTERKNRLSNCKLSNKLCNFSLWINNTSEKNSP